MSVPERNVLCSTGVTYSEEALYRSEFKWPKWNRLVTPLDVPQLLRRMLPDWTAERHVIESRAARALSTVLSTAYHNACAIALGRYGSQGPLISGCVRDHFPDAVKKTLRDLAHRSSFELDRSFAHWVAAGKRAETWRAQGKTYWGD